MNTFNIPPEQADEMGICPGSAEYFSPIHPEDCEETPEEAQEVQDGREGQE